MLDVCAAGRGITRDDDPRWQEPCDQPVTCILNMHTDDDGGRPRQFTLCEEHLDLVEDAVPADQCTEYHAGRNAHLN